MSDTKADALLSPLRAWQKKRLNSGPYQVPEYADFVKIVAAIERGATDLGAQAATIAELREALEWVVYHYDNQDMNHSDFRVEAAKRARQDLARSAGDE